MDYLKRAEELSGETLLNRRYFHRNAEVGLDMPKTKAYIIRKLKEYGIMPEECSYGVTAVIGKGEKTLLLRADADALPMAEKSGLEFACPTGKEAHTCGHDMHAAMLLTAAKMLKENEALLNGKVKLMFQTGEEILAGARAMVLAGVLENPEPCAALSFHVGPGGRVGEFYYNCGGTMMLSSDGFEITVTGKGGHSGYPNNSIDPIGTAVQIYTALEHLALYERDPEHTAILTVCAFEAGDAYNIIPEKAVMRGGIRTSDARTREMLVRRLKEIAREIAAANRTAAEVTMTTECPPLVCDPELTKKMAGFLSQLPGAKAASGIRSSGSDDFAEIASRIPSAYFYLAAGFEDRAPGISHNPEVIFNEEVLPFGAAGLAFCAEKWLKP